MEELKQAYERLGLPETAAREEVEKRYDLLLRRSRQKKLSGDPQEAAEGEAEFEAVNRAYRRIVDEEDRKALESLNQKQYGKYKKYAGQAQRVDHFFSYYKWHLLGGIAAIVAIIYGINAYMDHRAEQARLAALPPVDLEATFIGQFYLTNENQDTTGLKETLVKQMPGWKRVEASVLSFDMTAQDPTAAAMLQKAMVLLATEHPDVYVMDPASYEWVANSGTLISLDGEVEGRFKDLLPEGAAKRHAPPKDGAMPDENGEVPRGPERVYGIDLSASPLAKELPLAMNEMIVGIRGDAKHKENALAWIERYLRAAQPNAE